MADKQYKVIIEGENGAGSQVFEAETPEELQDQFKTAQTHATAKIREQARELAELRAARQPEPQPAPNTDADAWMDPLAPKIISKFFGGAAPEVIRQQYAEMSDALYNLKMREIATGLVNEMPELQGTSESDLKYNMELIGKAHNGSGFPPTLPGFKAHALLLEQENKLKLAPIDNMEMQPIPSTVTRPSVQVNTNESRNEFLTHAPTEEVRKLLEKEWAAKQRA